jgi:hypothetical protein
LKEDHSGFVDINDERIRQAVVQTEVLRAPRQSLATFGSTNIYYYLVAEPAYTGLVDNSVETVIREGRVIAERPRIVTPYYLSQLEGFSSEAKRYFEMLINTYGQSAPGLLYRYRNERKELNIVSQCLLEVVDKLNAEIDRRGDPLASIIKVTDELWDVSLMKFIYEMTRSSVEDNLRQLGSRGLLNVDASGVPQDARVRIEELFTRVAGGKATRAELKTELDRWDLFSEYEDRFFSLFQRR